MKRRGIVAEVTKKDKTKYVVKRLRGMFVVLKPVLSFSSSDIRFWQQCSDEYIMKHAAINKMKRLCGLKKYGFKVY